MSDNISAAAAATAATATTAKTLDQVMAEAFQANSILPAPPSLPASSSAPGSSSLPESSTLPGQAKSQKSKKVCFYFYFCNSSILNTFRLPGKKDGLCRQTRFIFIIYIFMISSCLYKG